MQGLNDTTLTSEEKVFIPFYWEWEKMCLSLHDNGANSYTFVNGVEGIEFKAKDSEIKPTPLCLGNAWKDLLVVNIKKTRLNGCIYDFSVDYDAIVVNDILGIHKYFMKKYGMI